MKKLKDVQKVARGLIQKEKDIGNTAMMEGVHNIVEMNWRMDNKAWWVTEQVSSDGYDSVKDAIDLMGTRNPKLTMTPYDEGDANRRQAEVIEEVLMWELRRVFARRGAANKEATKQAYKYGRVCAQIIYLPWQIEALKTFGKDTKREELALQGGDFMLKVYDARSVYPYWTDYGLEGVLVVSTMPAQEVLDFWGDKNTAKLKKHLDDKELEWVTQFDYWDLGQRTVWVVPHEKGDVIKADADGYAVLEMELDLPFLPWVVSDLGENLRPMLYAAWKSGQWDLMNVYLSASSSEVTAYIAYPRYKIEGPTPESVSIKMGEPGRPVEVPPGHDIQVLPPPGMDDTLTEKIRSLQAMVSKSTISHNVQTADFGPGAAYASIRELIDLTSRRLNDGKAILENFYRDVFIKMLKWVDFQDGDITAYTDDEYGAAGQMTVYSPGKFDGEGVSFDPNNLDFKVELTADIPEDQVSRHNAATLFTQLGGSRAKALEMVGISNPQKEIQRARSEGLEDAQHQAQIALIQGQAQLQLQQAGQQMQMQQMMQAQQAAQQQQQMQNPAMRNIGGQGANPAMGGMPPDIAAPGTSSPVMKNSAPQVRAPSGGD